MTSLEEELAKCAASANKLIVTDGVFSMKGAVANLPEIKRLAKKYNAKIMVDDAHGTGVLGPKGRGTPEHFDMEGQIDLICGTFSKTLSTIGGFIASKAEVVRFLKLNSRPFIFTASPPPAIAATVLACLEVLESEPELLQKLHSNSNFLKQGLKDAGFELEPTITPIIPVPVHDDEKTFLMAGGLEQEGVVVNPVVPPAVAPGGSLIRVSVMATFTLNELSAAVEKFKKVGKRVGII
jgi:8-amino-7-oxononanoate synthase